MNGVSIVDRPVSVPHGVILVLDDYLFMDQYHGDIQVSASEFSAIPMTSSSEGGFPMIELGTHDHDHDHLQSLKSAAESSGAVGDSNGATAALDRDGEAANETRPFYDGLIQLLSVLRSGTSDFLRYLKVSNLADRFSADDEYTAFVPMDDSFAQWYPIDWGFNPFDVDSFVRETMLNHFVRGVHRQETLVDGQILTTLGGKQLKVSTKREFDDFI